MGKLGRGFTIDGKLLGDLLVQLRIVGFDPVIFGG